MPISDEMLMKFMTDTIATTTRTNQSVNDLKDRIFPNGQPSAFQQLYTIADDHNKAAVQMVMTHTAQDVKDFKEVNSAVQKVARKLSWYSGGIAALTTVGGIIIGLLTWHATQAAAHAAEIANQIATHSH
jgi:hypothetical protein